MKTSIAMCCSVLFLLVASLAGTAAAAPDESAMQTVEVTVRSGDTLSEIAARHGCSVRDLRRWNPRKIDGDLIRAGDTLVVRVPPKFEAGEGPEWEAWYAIRRGDSLGRIAMRLGVSIADLRRWNRLKKGQTIRAGDLLRYKKRGPRPKAASVGRPTSGSLRNGMHLGRGEGYRLRFPRNAYGMPSMNETLRTCAARMPERFPGTADILYGDLSEPTGGRFPPHVSHQSGRDADVGYYIAGNKQNATMYRVGLRDIDLRKTWVLLECFLETDEVVRVYIDEGIQRGMARFLLKEGLATEAQVERLFEVRADSRDEALIHHAPGHDTHIHVRFACDQGDRHCAEEKADQVFRL